MYEEVIFDRSSKAEAPVVIYHSADNGNTPLSLLNGREGYQGLNPANLNEYVKYESIRIN